MSRQTFGRRVNTWLAEPKGQLFRDGKWRFWFPTLIGLTALNAFLTAIIFGSGGPQKYIGPVVLLAGAVLCWLALGLLHYSDSQDRALALGVAWLDSASLLFVAAHFSFLVWVYGHGGTLRAAEMKYKQDFAEWQKVAGEIRSSNDRIAGSAERIAELEKQTERLRNDTAYWARKRGVQASESGVKVELSTTKVEAPPQPKPPVESSAEYLAKWDAWIRLAGFGELALSIVTLILVRTRTSAKNSWREAAAEDFPEELDTESRTPAPRERLETAAVSRTKKKETPKNHDSFDPEAVKRLREALKDISFRLKGYSFKVTVKPDAVWIMMVKANRGTQESVASARANLDILSDVLTMPREAFRARLEKFLRQNGFGI